MIMATTTQNKVRPVTGIDNEFEHDQGVRSQSTMRIEQPRQTTGQIIGYIIAALAIIGAGFYFYANSSAPTVSTPAVTETAPPAAEPVTPPVDAPAAPPANTPTP
jgi:hypothetical protein